MELVQQTNQETLKTDGSVERNNQAPRNAMGGTSWKKKHRRWKIEIGCWNINADKYLLDLQFENCNNEWNDDIPDKLQWSKNAMSEKRHSLELRTVGTASESFCNEAKWHNVQFARQTVGKNRRHVLALHLVLLSLVQTCI